MTRAASGRRAGVSGGLGVMAREGWDLRRALLSLRTSLGMITMTTMIISRKEALRNMIISSLIGGVKTDYYQGRFIWMILKEENLIFLLMIFMIDTLKAHQEP